MLSRLRTAGLADIAEKLDTGVRLDFQDGVRLFDAPDLLAVGWLANRERERQHGARTYYNYNIRLEATNVCVASCLFCSFARLKPGDEGAYTMSLEEAWDKLRSRSHQPLAANAAIPTGARRTNPAPADLAQAPQSAAERAVPGSAAASSIDSRAVF